MCLDLFGVYWALDVSYFHFFRRQTTFLIGHIASSWGTCDGTFDAWNIFETGLLLSVRPCVVRLVLCPDVFSLLNSNMGPTTGHLIKMAQMVKMAPVFVSIFVSVHICICTYLSRGLRTEDSLTPSEPPLHPKNLTSRLTRRVPAWSQYLHLGVVYELSQGEHRCSWDPDYPEHPGRLLSVLARYANFL